MNLPRLKARLSVKLGKMSADLKWRSVKPGPQFARQRIHLHAPAQ